MMTRSQFSWKVSSVLFCIAVHLLQVTADGSVKTWLSETFDFFSQPHVNDENFGKRHQYPQLRVPWNVLIKKDKNTDFIRGGALLSDKFLLTFGRAQDWGKKNLVIEFGANHGKQILDFNSTLEKIFSHGNDSTKPSLTLMKLKYPLNFTADIYSAYLPVNVSKEEILGASSVLTGYRISNSSSSTKLIQGALMKTANCYRINKGNNKSYYHEEGILCASCDRGFYGGDKGDPMVYNGISGATLLAMGNGVVDCTVGKMFEFIDVTHYMDWINKTMATSISTEAAESY